MIAIQTQNLSKHFRLLIKKEGLRGAFLSFFQKEFKTVEAVRDLSFQIEKGELVGFLGPNGAGKTTTLKLLSGLLYPTAGSLSILGHVPFKRETEFLKKFSMVMGQRTQLWWDLPARETFRLNQKIYEIPDPVFRKRESELIELLELEPLVNLPVKKLSLGERMKAELACALLHEPEVLLLDEPTLGLDLVMQKKLRHFIAEYNRRTQATILLTSHNMNDVQELCKRVMIIDEGQLIYDGDFDRIIQHFAPDKVVAISSSQPIPMETLKDLGQILSHNGASAKMEVPRQSVSRVLEQLFKRIPLLDLTVEELPIEEIVRRVFLRTRSQSQSQKNLFAPGEWEIQEQEKKGMRERPLPEP
ncbi:MAG: ATP-binding cassette domain-containing protein [Elusimicrobia bacterium]|nr:ATP-binding cassette domain-containing protein [Elusimicrobiota bacterium]